MGGLLLISNDLSRTARLVRGLGLAPQCCVHDLYGEDAPGFAPDLIVGDVAQITSQAIVRLQRLLEPLLDAGAPFLFLMHGNAARAKVQARLVKASETLPAASAVQIVRDRIDRLQDQVGVAIAAKMAEEARQFF